jgi:lysophospholipase L1-like esterase
MVASLQKDSRTMHINSGNRYGRRSQVMRRLAGSVGYRWCSSYFYLLLLLVAVPPGIANAEEKKLSDKVRVLLLGDSTVIGSVCREMNPKADRLEDIVRKLLAAETDLPPVDVVNRGRDSDMIDRLVARYEKEDSRQTRFDFIFVRYGLNDICFMKDFKTEFPTNYRKLISRLRADHPQAEIVLETVIPYLGKDRGFKDDPHKTINEQVRSVAEVEKLAVLDQYTPYAAELVNGPNMLSYRRLSLGEIPKKYHALVPSNAIRRDPPTGGEVVYMFDNLLDVHLAKFPGWFKDRHPNLAGYQVIGAQLASYLAPRIRKRA